MDEKLMEIYAEAHRDDAAYAETYWVEGTYTAITLSLGVDQYCAVLDTLAHEIARRWETIASTQDSTALYGVNVLVTAWTEIQRQGQGQGRTTS